MAEAWYRESGVVGRGRPTSRLVRCNSFSMTAQTSARPGRNEPCHCGSGRKYKHCCLEKDDAQAAAARAKAAAEAAVRSSEAATSAPTRAPKVRTDQPWKATTSRGFIPRTRTPRKVVAEAWRRPSQSAANRKIREVTGNFVPISRCPAQPFPFDSKVHSFPMTAQTSARPGRNQTCHCGSGRKYKHCCLEKDDAQAAAARAKAAAEAAVRSSEAATSAPTRAPKVRTDQPWKATTSRGFIPRTRTPRKVGGS